MTGIANGISKTFKISNVIGRPAIQLFPIVTTKLPKTTWKENLDFDAKHISVCFCIFLSFLVSRFIHDSDPKTIVFHSVFVHPKVRLRLAPLFLSPSNVTRESATGKKSSCARARKCDSSLSIPSRGRSRAFFCVTLEGLLLVLVYKMSNMPWPLDKMLKGGGG